MSTTTAPRLQPPANDPPIAEVGGQHSQAWGGYFQGVADKLGDQADELASITAQLGGVRHGVTDGSDAAAGDIGEFLTTTSGAVSLTNGALANVASLSLTAGDWDVSGSVVFAAGSGTHTFFGVGIGSLDTFTSATFPATAINHAMGTPTWRRNVTATTTVWVVAEGGFSGTCTATGSIRARRMR